MTLKCAPDAPRLSELPGNENTYQCANCRYLNFPDRWQEHDHFDRPEIRAVVLCEKCADILIEPHPRLYRKLDPFEPFPGLMQICGDCQWSKKNQCTCPLAKHNVGKGITIMQPQGGRGFVCGNGGCHSFTMWTGHATSCTGKGYQP